MLLLVTGSSCSGKSTAAFIACQGLAGIAVHDSDEHGVPSDADTAWRHADLRRWVQHAIELDSKDTDLVLTGQSPIGELLAVPEAIQLDLAVCLIDVRDDVRSDRLEQRQPGVWSIEAKQAFNNWARWHRGHAADPAYEPEVITEHSAQFMRWDRWTSWERKDPRWSVPIIDSTEQHIEHTVDALRSWVFRTRSQRTEGSALMRGWSH